MKKLIFYISIVFISSCATIPPQLSDSSDKAYEGTRFMMERHKQTVLEMAENWYAERVARLRDIRQREIEKNTFSMDNPKGSGKVKMVMEEDVLQIDLQYQDALTLATRLKDSLINGYQDSENWKKLNSLQKVNHEWIKSYVKLNEEERKLFKSIAAENIPFPTDFINTQTKKLIEKLK